jgi:hypothetical protein
VAEEYCWVITRGHAAADQVAVCWSLDVRPLAFLIHTDVVDRMYTHFRLAHNLNCAIPART